MECDKITYFIARLLLGATAFLSLLGTVFAQSPTPSPVGNHLYFKEIIVRETVDSSWKMVFTGQVPSLPGAFLILHNAEGGVLFSQRLPRGEYTETAPFVVEIPKDGKTGDYRMIIVGQQDDMMGFNLPLSSLPSEVYTSSQFATRSEPPLWFVAHAGKHVFGGSSGAVKVFDAEKLLLDTPPKPGAKRATTSSGELVLEEGKTYSLDTRQTFYFSVEPQVFLTFDKDRLFLPDERLMAIKWWQLTGKSGG